MIDALLTRIGPRTGRYTSPHLQQVTERIAIDGRPISARRYVETWQEIAPFVGVVDRARDAHDGVHCSKFEVLTAMAFAAFADAPVDVAVIETGLGGSWDATNVADAAVAAITPIGLDHMNYLGSDITGIAKEKAGIIKPGSVALLAQQTPEVAQVLLERAVEVEAEVARAGVEFGVLERSVAVGGQQLRLQGLGGEYDDIYLPLFGEHQAGNAALALAAVEAFFGAGASTDASTSTPSARPSPRCACPAGSNGCARRPPSSSTPPTTRTARRPPRPRCARSSPSASSWAWWRSWGTRTPTGSSPPSSRSSTRSS